jgi:hypothetical protein
MIDLYGLGKGFPGTPVPGNLTGTQRVERIEYAMKEDICRKISDFRPDIRFVPYLSLYEFEALFFADPEGLAHSMGRSHLAKHFREIRDGFRTPEDIADGPETAPSKRIINAHSGYSKVLEGLQAAKAIGIQKMREQCPHFHDWLQRLENLPQI